MKSLALYGAALVLLAFTSVGGQVAYGHFPWLSTDDQGHALLFFGESPADRAYHTPEAIAKAEVYLRHGDKRSPVKLEAVETDDFIGRRSAKPVPKDAMLEMTCQYGLYHGMLLTYYSKGLSSEAESPAKADADKGLKLDVTPKAADAGSVNLVVTWEGKPAKGATVTLADASGETHEAKTNEAGEASFKGVSGGLAGVIANLVQEVKGELDGEPYTSAGHYATLTLQVDGPQAKKAASDSDDKSTADALPSLPEPVASFGAAVADGYLYVYGGHIGEEHAHSKDNLSQHFRRISLAGGEWEELPMQTALQGLPLVAHGGKLYRIGGLSFRNAANEDEDMHSVAEFACYDPAGKEWTALSPLPEARSSHDAVVIGDRLYVLGGWTLSGDSKGKWTDTAWSFDLTKADGKWEAVPSPNFRRRALAVAQWQDKLVALGGMTDDQDISRKTSALDLKSGDWSELPELPGDGMDGFGISAINVDGKLYASGTQDSLYRLSDDGKEWEAVAKLETPRFFHRLLPGKDGQLLAIAGASEDGHLDHIEGLSPSRRPALEQ